MTATELPSTVVLCCAAENRGQLGGVLENLGKEGLSVDVVSGVDLDSNLLATAIKRNKKAALYVLCRSEDLDRFQVSLLRQVLRTGNISNAHVLTDLDRCAFSKPIRRA